MTDEEIRNVLSGVNPLSPEMTRQVLLEAFTRIRDLELALEAAGLD